MVDCPDLTALLESKIDKILTQYRESPKLLGLIRNYLKQVELTAQEICVMPTYFDIDTAVGDQLTILGKILGWPRCHCLAERLPVFGFACTDDCYDGPPIVGFCESDEATWLGCSGPTHKDFCFDDDELYRKWLKARIVALSGDYRRPSFDAVLQDFFENTDAAIIQEIPGTITAWPGRALTDLEKKLIDLIPEVMPVAYGVKLKFAYGTGPIFGFGTGYAGLCDGNFINIQDI